MSQALAERLAVAEETIRQLREVMIPALVLPEEIGLTRREQDIVLFLMARAPNAMSRTQIVGAVHFDDDDGGPDPSGVDVFVCHARRKLSPYNVFIANRWGIGYSMSVASVAILRNMARR